MSVQRQDTETAEGWPALPLPDWLDTLETLHMWTQIVGKVKLELTPFVNEWWNVGLLRDRPRTDDWIDPDWRSVLPASTSTSSITASTSTPAMAAPHHAVASRAPSPTSMPSSWGAGAHGHRGARSPRARSSVPDPIRSRSTRTMTTPRTIPSRQSLVAHPGSERTASCSSSGHRSSARAARFSSTGARLISATTRFSGRPTTPPAGARFLPDRRRIRKISPAASGPETSAHSA